MGLLVKGAYIVERAIRVAPSAVSRAFTGYYRLPRQADLLAGDWNVLIVLDACRADYFLRVADPSARVVRSLAPCTRVWVRKFGELLAREGISDVLWFTANPVVDRDVDFFGIARVRLVSAWRTRWEEIGKERIPSVHPAAVNEEVRAYLSEHGQPERTIVHYIQPHAPYIGRRALRLARTGWGAGAFWHSLRTLVPPDTAVHAGRLTWQQLRDSYSDNLALAWTAAQELFPDLRGRVVVTADHGEVLGERGRFGHHCPWATEKLRRVPWLEIDRGDFQPAPVPVLSSVGADGGVQEKLRALGYM